MPEGDSIRRVAAHLGPLLVGKPLLGVRAGGLEHTALAGQTVVSVEPIGKHLLITTDGDVQIRTHLGMNGRWRRYPAGAVPPPSASLALATADDILVCSRAKTVEILGRRDPRRGAAVARLGPDILGDSFDLAATVARARSLPPETPIAQVLIDQRVAAGIGNIYRCEALFLERRAPETPVSALDDAAIAALFTQARAEMQASVRVGRRAARWVYGQTGQPCRRCGTRIVSGLDAAPRRIYWCPDCQAPRT
jgi:endonuclease-8